MIDAAGEPPRERPRWLLPGLIAFTVVCALLLVPGALIALTSPMMSDAGVNAAIWAVMLGAVLGPLVLLLSPVFAWIGYVRRSSRLTAAAAMAPLVWFFYLAVSLLLIDTMPRQ